MTVVSAAAPASQFTIGRVLSTAFEVCLRNALPFGIIALAAAAPYLFVRQLGGFEHRGETGLFVYASSSLVTPALLAHGTFQDLRGDPATAWQSFSRGLSRPITVLFGVLALALLHLFGFGLRVKGFLVMAAFWVYIPAAIVEKKGIVAGFKRSRQLTNNCSWTILGLLYLVFIARIAAFAIEGQIFEFALGAKVAIYIQIGLDIFYNAFSAVAITVGYYYLRADKEGVAVGDIFG